MRNPKTELSSGSIAYHFIVCNFFDGYKVAFKVPKIQRNRGLLRSGVAQVICRLPFNLSKNTAFFILNSLIGEFAIMQQLVRLIAVQQPREQMRNDGILINLLFLAFMKSVKTLFRRFTKRKQCPAAVLSL